MAGIGWWADAPGSTAAARVVRRFRVLLALALDILAIEPFAPVRGEIPVPAEAKERQREG